MATKAQWIAELKKAKSAIVDGVEFWDALELTKLGKGRIYDTNSEWGWTEVPDTYLSPWLEQNGGQKAALRIVNASIAALK